MVRKQDALQVWAGIKGWKGDVATTKERRAVEVLMWRAD